MGKLQTIVFVTLSFATLTYGIEVISYYPKGQRQFREGDSITLQCKSDDYYYFCDFINEKTTFKYSLDPKAYNDDSEYKVKNLNSGVDRKRARWLGDFYQYKKTGCKIQIKSATLQDAGSWSCKLEKWKDTPQNRGSQDTSTKTVTKIEIIPDFKLVGDEPLEPNVIKLGDTVNLECEANQMYESCSFMHSSTGKKCELSFMSNVKKDENPIHVECDDFQDKIDFLESSKVKGSKSCSIQLKDFAEADAGQWTCNLERYHGYGHGKGYGSQATREFTLEVKPVEFNLVSSLEETITAIEGGSVTLDCEADKNFETCTFMFNGEPVLMDDYISGEGTTKCSLELNDLRMLEDNGVYTCSLKFQNIERQRSITVNIQADHDFNISDNQLDSYTNTEGESLTLSCEVDHSYEYCAFKRNDKICELTPNEDDEGNWNDFNSNCDEFEFTEDSKSKGSQKCSISKKDLAMADQGLWTCELKKYQTSEYAVTNDLTLNVQAKPETTTTTSTTTTKIPETIPPTPSPKPESGFISKQEEIQLPKQVKKQETENQLTASSSISTNNKKESTTDDEINSSEDNTVIIVVVVIAIIAIVATAISVYILKVRKSPKPETNASQEEEGPIIKNQVTNGDMSPETVPLNGKNETNPV